MRIRRKKKYQPIEPDEILIDAQNLPGFDTTQLEGRIESPIERTAFRNFSIIVALVFTVFLAQLLNLQIVSVDTFKARAEANRLDQTLIISERGRIVDRNGSPLALNDPQEELGYAERLYPLGEASAHILGYVSYPKKDTNGFWFQTSLDGVAGIESSDNEALAGINGVEIKETNAIGDIVSGSIVRPPKSGQELQLSLDAGLQKKLYDLIEERSIDASFVGGSGIIMDVTTGQIHALVSYPSFDPATLTSGEPPELVQSYLLDARAPFLNRALSGLYTPGSVVKPFVAVAALEENIITPEKKILSTGSISVPNPYNPTLPSVFRDWKAHGWVNIREAIAVSSDVYFYEVGGGFEDQPGLGISTLEEYMRLFGFGAPTGIALLGEERGVIPNPEWKAHTFGGERWFLGNTYHTAIGQYGFQVTTLQLVRAIAAIANGGTLVTPTLEKGASGKKKKIGVDGKNITIVREGMRMAVREGTAAALNVSGVSDAAKTGTAEVGLHKEFINSLVVGFFPYEEPKFAFAVVMERAKAGTVAGAPLVMKNILEWMKTERPEAFTVQ